MNEAFVKTTGYGREEVLAALLWNSAYGKAQKGFKRSALRCGVQLGSIWEICEEGLMQSKRELPCVDEAPRAKRQRPGFATSIKSA